MVCDGKNTQIYRGKWISGRGCCQYSSNYESEGRTFESFRARQFPAVFISTYAGSESCPLRDSLRVLAIYKPVPLGGHHRSVKSLYRIGLMSVMGGKRTYTFLRHCFWYAPSLTSGSLDQHWRRRYDS